MEYSACAAGKTPAAVKKFSHGGSLLPVLAAIAGNTFWGFSFLFTRTALGVAHPNVLLSVRFILAFLGMNAMLLLGKGRISLKGKKIWPLFALGSMDLLYFFFESYGVLYTNSTFAGVVLAAVPVVAMALAALLLKEYPTRRQVFFSFLPVIGVIVITISGSAMGVISPAGVLLLLGACLVSAFFRILNRKFALEYTPFERTYFCILCSSIVFTLAAFRSVGWSFSEYIRPVFDPQFILPVITLSIFCSILSNLMVNYAAGRLSVFKLAAFGTISTVWSMFAGVLFLNEPITPASFAGSLLILIGISLVTRAPRGAVIQKA